MIYVKQQRGSLEWILQKVATNDCQGGCLAFILWSWKDLFWKITFQPFYINRTHTHQFATGVKEKALFRPPLKGGIVLRRFIIKKLIRSKTQKNFKHYSPCRNCISSLSDMLPYTCGDLRKCLFSFLASDVWSPGMNKETLTMLPSLRGHSSGAVLNTI